ncbi:hypothetical protein ACLB1N_24685 [Escherichia coli]
MDAMAYDYISPTRWDEGINTLTMTTIFWFTYTTFRLWFTRDRYQLSQSAQWTEYWTVAAT